MAKKSNKKKNYNTESHLALGRIACDDQKGIDAITACASRWLKAMEEAKWPRAIQYFENASFLQGNHLTRFFYSATSGLGVHTFGVHDKSPFDGIVAKVADNRLIRPIETVVGMLTSDLPWPEVAPNSDWPEDEDAAALAATVLDVVFEHPLNMRELRQQAAMVAAICGTAAIETEYGETDQPVAVPKMKKVKRPNPMWREGDPKREKEYTAEEPVPGEFDVVMREDVIGRLWTPFHLTPDPAATSFHDMRWIARTTFEDIDWVIENFAKDEEGYVFSDEDELRSRVQDDSLSRYTLYWWSRFNDILEAPQQGYITGGLAAAVSHTMNGQTAPNQTAFVVIDVKPTRQYPKGRTLIFAGGVLVYHGDARAWTEQYPTRWHPYSFFSWFTMPGKFWGTPLLSLLVPLQKRINAIDSLVQANRQFMSIGQWTIPRHAKVAETSISGVPGHHILYTDAPGMSSPDRVQHTPLPAELLVEREQLIEAIDYIAASGVTGDEVAKSAARSGPVLEFLKGEKMRSKVPMLQGFQKMLEKVAQNVLIDVQLNMVKPDSDLTQRIQQAARSRGHSFAVESFSGSNLRDHHSVRIDITSEITRSPEAKAAMALEVAQYLGPQMSPAERAGVFRAAGMDQFIKNQENASVSRARRMISRLRRGQLNAFLPMPGIDNASAMAPIFQSELLGEQFIDYPQEVQQVLLAAFDHYSKMAAQEQQQAIQLQMMLAQGGGGAQSSSQQ